MAKNNRQKNKKPSIKQAPANSKGKPSNKQPSAKPTGKPPKCGTCDKLHSGRSCSSLLFNQMSRNLLTMKQVSAGTRAFQQGP